jgi:hypothetical protein
MTEIEFRGLTYIGTADGEYGVFTKNIGGSSVYAGKIVHRCASVGVFTSTYGTTEYVECNADGKWHGRYLRCDADGGTVYALMEHGITKESARLRADGRCYYNGKACRADFAALQAKVLPIKARPHQRPHSRPLPHLFAPIARRSLQSAIVLALAGAGDDPRRQGARPTPPSACMTHKQIHPTAPAKQMHRASNLDDAPGGRVHYAWDTNHMHGAPFPRPVPSVRRSGPPCASAFSITCCTPFSSVAGCGGLRMSVVHPTRRAHARQRASPSRFPPRTCTAAPSYGPNLNAHSTHA